MSDPTLPAAGLTVLDFSKRYRISPDKVRAWIVKGELAAINTASALCGKPRYVITPEALADFEKRRSAGPTPKPRRRRKRTLMVDYYAD